MGHLCSGSHAALNLFYSPMSFLYSVTVVNNGSELVALEILRFALVNFTKICASDLRKKCFAFMYNIFICNKS